MTITIFAMIMAVSMMIAALMTLNRSTSQQRDEVRKATYQNWKQN